MNTSVALADIASRTILYLAGAWVVVKLAPPLLARAQVGGPKYPPQQPVPPVAAVVLDGQDPEAVK